MTSAILNAMSLPTLYKRTSTGKIQMWRIQVLPTDGRTDQAIILTRYGLLDGKQMTASESITEGKNLGKTNETTPVEQAELEAKSQWEKKVKKGYVENLDDAEAGKVNSDMIVGGIEPMLAHTYEKQGHKIKWPAYVQPKLDGHRCIAIYQDGEVTLWSRTRKKINSMPHIVKALEETLADVEYDRPIILDGELYNHDYRENFEELTGYIRSETPKPGYEVVQYWVYDIVIDAPFSTRDGMLGFLKQKFDGRTLIILDSYLVDDEEEMMELLTSSLDLGFEGIMVRNANGLYKHGRSYDLLKVKTFIDSEFEVIDITEGRGKMAGKAMFHCLTPEGKEFRVKMVGALDDLEKYLVHKEDYLHKMLTVKYQNLSNEGIPRFPVALRFREDV